MKLDVIGYHRRRDDLVAGGLSVWHAMTQAHREWHETSERRRAA